MRNRFIPVLLMDNKSLIKTKEFSGTRYLGDPVNTILTFNEKKVDELILIDIKATVDKKPLDFDFLEKCARSARMPLCYSGGVKSLRDAVLLVEMGFEKICINSAHHDNPQLVTELSQVIGSQSVMICLDVREVEPGVYKVYTRRGSQDCGNLLTNLKKISNIDIGEVLISNMSRDGMKNGIDDRLLNVVLHKLKVPITYVGGAADKQELISKSRDYKGIGLGAGSAFIFSGKRDAVLPTYIRDNLKRTREEINL